MKNTPHSPSPPRWADRLLRWRLPTEQAEEVEGDLHELYRQWVKEKGERKARRRYLLNVLGFLRPLPKRQPECQPDNQGYSPQPFSFVMIRNYLKIAFRTLLRHKAYTFINVSGLALGISCGILIFALVSYHLRFDDFHPDSNRIYRLVTEEHRETVSYVPNVPSPLGKAFRNDYTFGEKVARIATADGVLITIKGGKQLKKFKEEEGVAFTESEFFDIFNYPLLRGDKRTVLREPNTAILTERMAKKYFGEADPMNQTFRLDNRIDFKVTGILKDLPRNTDRKTEIYVSYVTLRQFNEWLASDSWGGITSDMQCFVRLRPGVTPRQVEQVLPAYVKKYRPTSKNVHHYKLQPLSDIHFNAHYWGVMTKSNLWVLGFIGLFLIVTACVNFINLATAQALNRAKEVGIRKVLGSFRGQLFWQFMAETALITGLAVILAVGISGRILPYINEWLGAKLVIDLSYDWQLSGFILLLTLVVTFLAGSYPGLLLARFQPVLALKGQLSQQAIGGFNLRRILIVAQFAISQVLIIGMVVIANQMQYANQADLGFNKEAVVLLPVASESKIQTMNTLKDRLSKLSGVKKVSLCQAAPATSENNWTTSLRYDNRAENEIFGINVRAADDQYLPMFELPLVAGRNIFPSDTVKEFVVNEMFAQKLNLPSAQELLGKTLSINGDRLKGPIVGVVRDFHHGSFHEDINAVCITSHSDNYSNYAVKIDLANVKGTLAALEKTWSGMHADQIFEYQFVDEQIAEFYETEALMLKLIQAFAGIAIFIGCLGLYGLVSFMATRKAKEIGIRRVLGSSVGQILWLFAKEFSRLIVLAFLVAAPLAYWAMSTWLENFQYQIELGVAVFVPAMLSSVLVALATVGYRTVRAALANPIQSLRSE